MGAGVGDRGRERDREREERQRSGEAAAIGDCGCAKWGLEVELEGGREIGREEEGREESDISTRDFVKTKEVFFTTRPVNPLFITRFT